jgi:hypothetical protein
MKPLVRLFTGRHSSHPAPLWSPLPVPMMCLPSLWARSMRCTISALRMRDLSRSTNTTPALWISYLPGYIVGSLEGFYYFSVNRDERWPVCLHALLERPLCVCVLAVLPGRLGLFLPSLIFICHLFYDGISKIANYVSVDWYLSSTLSLCWSFLSIDPNVDSSFRAHLELVLLDDDMQRLTICSSDPRIWSSARWSRRLTGRWVSAWAPVHPSPSRPSWFVHVDGVVFVSSGLGFDECLLQVCWLLFPCVISVVNDSYTIFTFSSCSLLTAP